MQLRGELIAATLAAAVLGAVLVAPRATPAAVLPMPHVDFAALRAAEVQARERVRVQGKKDFPRPVRRVGEKLRRFGAASFVGMLPPRVMLGYVPGTSKAAQAAFISELARLGHQDAEDVLRLRDYQSELFVKSVRAFEESRALSVDLVELGGDFVAVADQAWFEQSGRLVLSDQELKLLFRVRFALVSEALESPLIGPSRDEMLAYYGLLLQRPPVSREAWPASRVGVILAIGKLDPSYPVDFARGLALLDAGSPVAARAAFEAAPARGAWARLRQNSLLYAQELTQDTW
jgi:hypothetical protein